MKSNEQVVEKLIGDDSMSEALMEIMMPLIEPIILKRENERLEQGMQRGIQQGIQQSIQKTVAALSKLGHDDAEIAAVVKEQYDLTEEEIKKYMSGRD